MVSYTLDANNKLSFTLAQGYKLVGENKTLVAEFKLKQKFDYTKLNEIGFRDNDTKILKS